MDEYDVRTYLDSFDHRDWEESDPDDGPIRFAMVGLGWWTRDKAMPAVENSTFCETTAVVSGSKEKAEEVAAEDDGIEAALTYEEFHDGQETDAYDAVYVCTPNARHLELVESAAEQEKAILCEKPMEADVERSEGIVEACEDVPAMIAYRMHTEPAIRRARELIDAGVIGEPIHVHGDMSQSIVGWGENQWRLDPDLVGYGASVMDLGVYPLNTARYVLDRDPVSLQATMHSEHEYFEDVPDEVAAFSGTYEGDVHVAFTASQNAHLDSHLRIHGNEGVIAIEPAFHGSANLRVSTQNATIDVETPDVDQMEEEFDYFADCLLADRELHADPEHGLVDMQAMAAIYESAETGERVDL